MNAGPPDDRVGAGEWRRKKSGFPRFGRSLISTDALFGRWGHRREQEISHFGAKFLDLGLEIGLWKNALDPEPPANGGQGVGAAYPELFRPVRHPDPVRLGHPGEPTGDHRVQAEPAGGRP